MLSNYVEMAIIDLDKSGKTDQALNALYDNFYDNADGGYFESIDDSIEYYAKYINEYSLDLALGVLVASLPARHSLVNRPKYLELAVQKAKDCNEYSDTLFYGL